MSARHPTTDEASRPALPRLPSPTPADAEAVRDALSELYRFRLAPPVSEDGAPDLRSAALAALDEPPAAEGSPESDTATTLGLLRKASASRLTPARAAFRDRARTLAQRAGSLAGAGSDASAERDDLGAFGSRFLDPSALAEVLEEHYDSSAVPATRRARLSEARDALSDFLTDESPPELLLIVEDPARAPGDETAGWRVEVAEDACAAAAQLFDREAERIARVLAAARRVDLESRVDYDSGRHGPWLERFDWQAMSREELLLLTPVVAVVAADRVAGPAMGTLSRLLRSGRPVQVLVTLDPAASPGEAEGALLVDFRFEPAYLGLSHREALVQQTTTARPDHMESGFVRALSAPHTCLHVIADGPAAQTAAIASRAHPLLRYDPEAGATWADRFELALNPQPAEDWPVLDLSVEGPSGGETLSLALTFADFVLGEPAYGGHFRPIPEVVPGDRLIPLAEQSRSRRRDQSITFLWALDDQERLVHLAVSRPLALACRDRLGFWRTLQELAGVATLDQAIAPAAAGGVQPASGEDDPVSGGDGTVSRVAAELQRLIGDRATASRDARALGGAGARSTRSPPPTGRRRRRSRRTCPDCGWRQRPGACRRERTSGSRRSPPCR